MTTYDDQGRTETSCWPGYNQTHAAPQPSPPPWLHAGITILRSRYPDSSFEPVMKPHLISTSTDTIFRPLEKPVPGDYAPEGCKVMYLPRILCHDCPDRTYTTLPLNTVEGFGKHLEYCGHRENAQERRQQGQ